MKADNPIQTKSYAFALRIVKLYRFLCDEKKDFVLSKQIVRSGTSIGANVEELIGGQSNKDSNDRLGRPWIGFAEDGFFTRPVPASDRRARRRWPCG